MSQVLSIERVVALLTPTVFAPLSALVVRFVAQSGGPKLDGAEIITLEGLAFSGAVAMAYKWLHGRQKYVEHLRPIVGEIGDLTSGITPHESSQDIADGVIKALIAQGGLPWPTTSSQLQALTMNATNTPQTKEPSPPAVATAATDPGAAGVGVPSSSEPVMATDIPPAVNDPAPSGDWPAVPEAAAPAAPVTTS